MMPGISFSVKKNMERAAGMINEMNSRVTGELMAEVTEDCRRRGANAVVGARVETSSMVDGTVKMMFYGTAVRFSR